MSLALLGARLLLSGVFAAAGLAKLADREGSRRAVAEFGVPRRLAWLIGGVLPFAELATAGALIPHFSAMWGALAAAALLLSFSAAIAFNLARGRTPECRCFGQVHSAPVSWRMVARNLALAVGAAAVVAGEGVVAIGAAVALAVVLLFREAPALAKGLAVGTSAPRFESLPELLAPGRPVLLVFASRHCAPCLELEPELEEWRREHADRLTISVLEREDAGVEAIFEAYGMDATPAAVLLGADGRIASGVAPGATAIRRLVTGEPAEATEGMRRREFVLRVAGGVAGVAALLAWAPGAALARATRRTACPDPAFPDVCPDGCKNKLIDSRNCRTCGRSCSPRICAGGNCVGPMGTEVCDGSGAGHVCCYGKWTNVWSDEKSCGGCVPGPGKVCGPYETCCNGVCRAINVDAQNCGACGKRCPPDKPVCTSVTSPAGVTGECVKKCPPGTDRCGGTCGVPKWQRCCGGHLFDKIDYPIDKYLCCEGKLVKPIKCGGKPACPGTKTNRDAPNTCCHKTVLGKGQGCCGGRVYSKADYRCCNGKSVSLLDPKNCNGCGKPCKKFEVCEGAVRGCVCPLGAECAPPLPHP